MGGLSFNVLYTVGQEKIVQITLDGNIPFSKDRYPVFLISNPDQLDRGIVFDFNQTVERKEKIEAGSFGHGKSFDKDIKETFKLSSIFSKDEILTKKQVLVRVMGRGLYGGYYQ
ncbi:hypothetical protein H4219_002492 [Mycoemilia scoparia]|uniref:Uncharacterized protein n=1 Tax=Mycoemilia scoparia TaxID=417184 RepID=A0A9W8A3W0_9FUNG|nr:hypothetical protein H4219_002492 [Mycoemilia scoparia]